MNRGRVFLSGATGYLGRPLVSQLVASGAQVRVLARKESVWKVPEGVEIVVASALRSAEFAAGVSGCSTYVHLTGVASPAPWKVREFRRIDLESVRASAVAAQDAGVSHFVYVSVAQPAPVMKEYIRVRGECEEILAKTDLPLTVLRPWYIIGPGHYWPLVFTPLYSLAGRFEATREGAARCGLLRLNQMTSALRKVIERGPQGVREVLDVPAIRRLASDG